MMLLLLASAYAADGPGPFLAPSATPMEGHLDVSAGAAAVESIFPSECVATPVAEPSVDDPDHLHPDPPSDSTACGSGFAAVGGGFLEVRGQPMRALGLHAAALTAFDGSGEVLQADARFTLVDTEHVHFAPWAGVIVAQDGTVAGAGVSFDAGGKVATFDVSVPLIAAPVESGADLVSVPSTLLATEAGVTFHLSPTQSLRVGMESLAPGMAYRGEFGPMFVQARVYGLVLANGGTVEVGFHI